MRRFLCFLLLVWIIAVPSRAQTSEVRGVWITNVDSQVLFSKSSIAEAMDYLASRGFNVIFPVVWNKGYTLYPSDVMDETFGIRQDPALGGRDPLAEIIVEAHRNGMEVMPWFEYGFATEHTGADEPPQGGGHIAQAFPQWLARDSNGDILKKNGFEWMNGLHPEVQDFILSLILEVVENYDIDGIQGDDRLPAMPSEGGYSDFTRGLYAAEHDGAEVPSNPREAAFLQWKADKLTSFAGRIYRAVKEQNEDVTVSFSPSIYPWSLQEYLQDWPRWLDSAYVDLVHPQAYRWDIGSYKTTMQAMVGTTPDLANGYLEQEHLDKIFPGLIIKAGSRFNDWQYVREAVDFNREYGVQGEVYFFYEGLREKNDFLADSLHKYFYDEPAVMPGRDESWRPLPVIVNETDGAVSAAGPWESAPVSGFDGGMLRAPAGSGATLNWTLTAPSTGTFDIYAFQPRFRSDATRGAVFTSSDGEREVEVVVDQWSNSVQGWMPIGRFSVDHGEAVTVRLDADAAQDGGASYGDAVMMLLNRNPDSILAVPTSAASSPERPLPGLAIRIHPAFPQPASDSTMLSFTLASTSAVTIDIFDLMGRRVASVVDGDMMHPGRHDVRLDVAALAVGTYVCRVTNGEASASRSLVVLR